MDDITLLRIDTLLKHIDQVFEDTKGKTIVNLEKSNLLLRAVCFSVAQIGEMMVQLEKHLSGKYSDLPWSYARSMRNIIVHDYGKTDVEQVYSTICNDLPELKKAFLKIKEDILKESLSKN